jgi:hypothetical protein
MEQPRVFIIKSVETVKASRADTEFDWLWITWQYRGRPVDPVGLWLQY